VFCHHLGWEEIDGFVASFDRLPVRTQGSRVLVLFRGRFVTPLPLPTGSRASGRDACDSLEALCRRYAGHDRMTACPVRILGGLRGRPAFVVLELDANGGVEPKRMPPGTEGWLPLVRYRHHRDVAVAVWERRVAELAAATTRSSG
jgi:hypothetical protein